MKNFREYLNEELNKSKRLDEKLITFGGEAYPNFGQVVILAGGAGSGKGFVVDNLLGVEGNTMDVDYLKELVLKSEGVAKKIKEEYGVDVKDMDLKNPKNVTRIHTLVNDKLKIDMKMKDTFFNAVKNFMTTPDDRKPNVIFDVTLKDMNKLRSLTDYVKDAGYKSENIHIVWVVNDVNVALKQNAKRSRVVPDEILISTHEGVSLTMRKIVDAGDDIKKYMDGDIWFAFNKAGVDTDVKKSDKGGMYIEKANYIQIKKQGKKPLRYDQISQNLIDKIDDYSPQTDLWK